MKLAIKLFVVPLIDALNDFITEAMIMIKNRKGISYEPGINALKTILEKRLEPDVKELFQINQSLNNPYDLGIFDTEATRLQLFKMTGGHVRELMLLLQSSMDWVDALPITEAAVKRAINEARDEEGNTTNQGS